MKKQIHSHLLIVVCLFIQISASARHIIRIACVGNSITAGARLSHPEKNAYPAQLQQMLGDNYEVFNFGVSGRTVLRNCDRSYMATRAYKDALNSNPDIVFIKLGTNDS